MARTRQTVTRPASAVHALTGPLGVVGLAAGIAFCVLEDPDWSPVLRAVAVCVATALPMVVFRLARSGAQWCPGRQRVSLVRVATRLLGLYTAYAAMALGYWLFPEYSGSFYDGYFAVLLRVWPWLVALAVPYFLWLDQFPSGDEDGCWHAGMAVLGQWRRVAWETVWQFARGWLVKAFFLPLMFVYTVGSVSSAIQGLETTAWLDPNRWYVFVLGLIFMVDLTFACVGYSLTLRFFGNQIRSADPTLMGWFVALICYQPFWSQTNGLYLAYNPGGMGWGAWLAGTPVADIWPLVILFLLSCYAWATVSFGLRFSNLTHRGIITNGPYRLTKHPAYIMKNISWWLIAVPFVVTGSWHDALRNCLLLLIVNVVYYLRARTEERHLAQDPVYVQYALWIEQHGWLRKMGLWWPRAFAFRWRTPVDSRRALGLRRAMAQNE